MSANSAHSVSLATARVGTTATAKPADGLLPPDPHAWTSLVSPTITHSHRCCRNRSSARSCKFSSKHGGRHGAATPTSAIIRKDSFPPKWATRATSSMCSPTKATNGSSCRAITSAAPARPTTPRRIPPAATTFTPARPTAPTNSAPRPPTVGGSANQTPAKPHGMSHPTLTNSTR